MRNAFDFSQEQATFALFSCRFDNALTLMGPDPQLEELLGFRSSTDTIALTDFICDGWTSRAYHDISRQLSLNHTIEYIFPIHRNGRNLRWLLARGRICGIDDQGVSLIQGVLVDITTLKNQYDKNRHIAERYHLILEQTGEVMFEWDVLADSVQFSEGWKYKFGYIPQTSRFTTAISANGHIHPEDIQNLLTQVATMRNGLPFLTLEIRISSGKGSWIWCKIRACGIYDNSRRLTHIIGLIIDIDDEKRNQQELQDQATQDSLTKLLNAHTTRMLAEQYLHNHAEQVHCAMLILDVDNFKHINDKYGHLFGDEILICVADILKRSFRNDDIVGRIGGDEFFVLMKNISDTQKIHERCAQLLDDIRNAPAACRCSLTASIGVSIVSGTPARYNDLFLQTDDALYQAKDAGRDCHILCQQ